MVQTVSEQMRSFAEARQDEARRLFHKMVAISFGFAAAALLLLAFAVILQLVLETPSVGQMIWPWGIFVLAVSLVILSSCPLEEVDLDEVLQSRPVLRISVSVTAFGMELLVGIASKPHIAHMLVAACALLLMPPPRAAFGGRGFHLPRATLLLGIYLAGERCATILSRGYAAIDAGSGSGTLSGVHLPGHCWWMLAWVCLAGSTFTLGFALMKTRRRERRPSPTVVLGNILYCHFFMVGVDGLFLGSLVEVHSVEKGTGTVLLLCGTAFILPLLLLACGPSQIFEVTLNRFTRDSLRAEKDGAFIAGLINSAAVVNGQVWWVHREEGEEDYAFDAQNHRHRWRRGCVIETTDSDFAVALPPERRGVASASHSSSQSTDMGSEALAQAVVYRIPLGVHNRPWPELVAEAQSQLRCIDWQNITQELLRSGVVCGTSDKALMRNQYYSLSRDAGPTEIDYFMSHSWHDDADVKWLALQKLARAFKRKHGRYPTFWLDKACIDQENLADGLRVLPVNVMACRRVLVLCGESYTSRLWCIWELFTLMAFASLDQALERLHVVPLGSVDSIRQLTDFDVDAAHCYDPNEERRLKHVIEGLGKGRFNMRVQELGAACLEAQQTVSDDGILRYGKQWRKPLQLLIHGGAEVAATFSFRHRGSVSSAHSEDNEKQHAHEDLEKCTTPGGSQRLKELCVPTDGDRSTSPEDSVAVLRLAEPSPNTMVDEVPATPCRAGCMSL